MIRWGWVLRATLVPNCWCSESLFYHAQSLKAAIYGDQGSHFLHSCFWIHHSRKQASCVLCIQGPSETSSSFLCIIGSNSEENVFTFTTAAWSYLILHLQRFLCAEWRIQYDVTISILIWLLWTYLPDILSFTQMFYFCKSKTVCAFIHIE